MIDDYVGLFGLQWHDLADAAKARSCYWRFVLLGLSVLRAEILSNGIGAEMAELDALLVEAAELASESEQKTLIITGMWNYKFFPYNFS